MTAINIALVLMAVLFIGGMVFIGRLSGKAKKPDTDQKQRPF